MKHSPASTETQPLRASLEPSDHCYRGSFQVDNSGNPGDRKGFPWSTVARVAVAVALISAVLWFVPVRDQLHWPSRLGPEPLSGSLERTASQVVFRADSGAVAIFHADGAAKAAEWSSVELTRPGGETERLELTSDDRAELKNQPEEGLLTTFKRLDPAYFALSILLVALASAISFHRWFVLLRAVRVEARLLRAMKLGMLGLFFNNVVPGLTGGDLIKAIYVARDHPEQRPEAVLSVLVDRAVGLLGLVIIAAGALLFNFQRFHDMALMTVGLLAAVVAGCCVVFSRRLRRLIRLSEILQRLPGQQILRKLDEAILLYRAAPKQAAYALVASFGVHTLILTSVGVMSLALDLEVPWVFYFALAPLPMLAQSVPIAPAGIGVGEAAYVYFFSTSTGLMEPQQALALALSFRLVQLLFSLSGGLCLLFGDERVAGAKEMQAAEAALSE